MPRQGESLRKGEEELSELSHILQGLTYDLEKAEQQLRRQRLPGPLWFTSGVCFLPVFMDGCHLWNGLGCSCADTPVLFQHILWSLCSLWV